MPIDPSLLSILACPITKRPVRLLPMEAVLKLNDLISHGVLRCANGELVEQPLEEALVTDDGTTIYQVRDGVPIMLADEGVPAAQLGDAGWLT